MIYYLCIFFLFLFSSCAKSERTEGQTAKLSVTTDPKMLDPRRARDLDSITLLHMLFEGLTRTSKDGKTELALAENVEISEDGLRYLFHLRKSLWSNGLPLTADDFSTSWKAILDPKFCSDIAYQLYPIKNARLAKLGEIELETVGVQALDDHTLAVELEQPLPYFLELLSMPSFFPVPINIVSQNVDWNLSPEKFVSNGPFSLQNWKHSDQLTLMKNDHYWEADSVKLSSIDFLVAPPDTALQMYEEGKLDWTGSPLSIIPTDAVRNLKKSNRLEISPFLATYFFRVNISSLIDGKANPLACPNIRRSLAFALDRNGIVNHILQGGQKAARSLVPPEMGLSVDGYFVEKQAELDVSLDEPITISYSNTDERNAAVAQAVQTQWEKALGIKVQLEAVEPKVFYQRVSKKEYQIAAGSWTADFNDPVNFLEVFKYKNESTNNTGWENLEYIDLLNRSSVCKSKEERNQLLRKAEEILMEEMPIIPVFHYALNYIRNPQFSGVALSPMGQLDLRWAYFEPSMERGEKR
jgi:oligopeptide transport system substrate-binding protein